MSTLRHWLTAGSVVVLAAAHVARAAEPASRSVAIEQMRFTPQVLTVRRGETIVWTNRDLFPHTVTSDGFDSASIAPGASWTWTANKTGRFGYVCTLHPSMKATLVVEPSR